MTNTHVSAFTYKARGIVNVLLSKVKVSANKELFKNAKDEEFNAIWDTGASHTAISSKVVQKCGLIPTGKATVNTASGENVVNTYIVDIALPNNVNIKGVQATEFTAVEGSDLLIGMDIMGLGDLAISNFEGKTTFSFRIPSIACTDYVKQIQSMKPVTATKVGRNDPCPCGSGKKYKQCHGR